MERWMDGQTGRQTDKDRYKTDELMDGEVDGWTDR
jgi:hypothetical protein